MDQKKLAKRLIGLSSLVLAFLLGAHVRGCGSQQAAVVPTPAPVVASPKVCPFPHGETKVITKVVTKTIIKKVPVYQVITEVIEVEKPAALQEAPKVVTVVQHDKRLKHRLSVIGGAGQTGFDVSQTALSVTISSKLRPIGGLQYQYALTNRFNLGVVGLSHGTFGASVGFDF